MTQEKARKELVCQILSYLSGKTKAQDTLEGIVEWWLLEQEIRRSQSQVRQALEELIESGLVQQERGADGRARFRLNPARQLEIESRLRQGGATGEE